MRDVVIISFTFIFLILNAKVLHYNNKLLQKNGIFQVWFSKYSHQTSYFDFFQIDNTKVFDAF